MRLRVAQLRCLIEHALAEAVRQQTPYSCGAACVKFIVEKLCDEEITEPTARDQGRTSKFGTAPEGIRDALQTHGLKARVRKRLTHDQILKSLKKNEMIVLDVTMWDGAHWVVAHDIDADGNVLIMDPSLGKSRPIDAELLDSIRWRQQKNSAGSNLRGGIITFLKLKSDS